MHKNYRNVVTTIDHIRQLPSSPVSKERETTSWKTVTYDHNLSKYEREFSEERPKNNFDLKMMLSKHLSKVESKGK